MRIKKHHVSTPLFIPLIPTSCEKEGKSSDTTNDQGETSSSKTSESAFEAASNEYLAKVDVDYSYNFTKGLGEFKTNEKLGFGTAGSEAEIQTGNKIYKEMKKIGLQDVTRDEFTLDTWTLKKADLSFTDANGQQHDAVLGAYI